MVVDVTRVCVLTTGASVMVDRTVVMLVFGCETNITTVDVVAGDEIVLVVVTVAVETLVLQAGGFWIQEHAVDTTLAADLVMAASVLEA